MTEAVVKPAVRPNETSSKVGDENKEKMDHGYTSNAPASLSLTIFEMTCLSPSGAFHTT